MVSRFSPTESNRVTQLGLSNTGTETIGTDAELMPEVSPTSVSGTYAGYSNNDTVTQNRYLSYNTKTSKLWNNFAKEFANEIKSAYQQLRSKGIYTVDNIINNAKSMTIDEIGEIYYNKDMASKYLSQVNSTSSEFLKALHGNRIQKVIKVIRERLLFCDTLFEYMESDVQTDTLNSVITLRSDAFYGNNASGTEASTLKCSIGISVYTPMYVTVNVGSGLDAIITAYVSPNSTYSDPATGLKMEGTLFTFPIKATDKEMIISGAGNIKSINRLEELNVRDLTIAKAEKILKLNLSNSTRMTTLTLGNNRLLRELDCSMSYLLGTGTGGQTLNLEKCLNLKKLDVSYTKLTSMILPTNSSLETIIADGSTIKSLHVDGMEFLTEISIDACENIETYSINNCPRLTRVDVSESSVKTFSVTNCSEVTSIDVSKCRQMTSFDLTNSEKINSLNMSGNTGSVMKDLKLYTLYGLKALDVSNTTSLENIRFPKYASKEETDKANNGQDAVLWNNLETFNLRDSSIKYIQYGSEELAEGSKTCNMAQLTKLSSITFSGCTVVEGITNLNYSASSLSSLFQDCQRLVSVQGSLTATSDVSNIFYNCYELNDISSLSFNFTGVTKANGAFCQCSKIKTSQIKKLLDACGSSLEEINNFADMWSVIPTLGSVNDDTRTLSKEVFENTPNIKTARSAFWKNDYTTINGDLFENLNNLQNISFMFAESVSLITVNSNLIKNKPSLINAQGLFAHCRKLENYINDDCDIFEGSFNITDVSEFFSRDSKLKATTIEGILDPLTNITNATAMFIGCSNLICPIPNGLLAKNTKLQKIDCMFTGCTGITLICERLFRKLLTDTNNLPDLTQARGVFSGCSKMTGIVSANFFLGAGNLMEMGDGYNYTEHNTATYYTADGFFANTAITGYHETFLSPLTKLVNCRGMFYKSSANNTLRNCYYYDGSEEKEYLNTVGEKIFDNNKSLQNCANFFQNNASLVGHIPSKLFNNCITTIRYVYNMFCGCSSLNGTNLDNTNENISSFTGISDWFNGATNLLNCSAFMQGCSLFNGNIHEDLFKDCTSLQNCSSFFYGCSLINGGIPRGLFDSCRSTLVNTSNMFRDCVGLEGKFPVGSYEVTQGINGYELCLQSDEGALQIVSNVTNANTQISYSIVVTMSPNLASMVLPDSGYYVKATIGDIITVVEYGLLSDCTQLANTSYMFYNCQNLGRDSSIPHDLFFTSSLTKRYMNLTNVSHMFYRCAFDKAHIDEETRLAYLCDANFFNKCPALTDISNCFRALHSIPSCQIYQNMFAKQTALQNASHVFRDIPNLTGAITQTLLMNSLGTLINVQGMFAYTNMTSVVAGFLHGEMKNTKLMYVQGIFYNCSNLTGGSPEFWDSTIFTKLETSSSGYYGALYNCTKLGNYNTAQNISPNWTANIGWTRY